MGFLWTVYKNIFVSRLLRFWMNVFVNNLNRTILFNSLFFGQLSNLAAIGALVTRAEMRTHHSSCYPRRFRIHRRCGQTMCNQMNHCYLQPNLTKIDWSFSFTFSRKFRIYSIPDDNSQRQQSTYTYVLGKKLNWVVQQQYLLSTNSPTGFKPNRIPFAMDVCKYTETCRWERCTSTKKKKHFNGKFPSGVCVSRSYYLIFPFRSFNRAKYP